MSDLDKVFDRVLDLLKGLKPGTVAGGRAMPSIKQPSVTGGVQAPNKISGVSQSSQKSPVKSAEQIQNADIKDQKMKDAQSALKVKPLDINKEEDAKPAHTAEGKMKQMNQAYDRYKSQYKNAKTDADKKYIMGHLDRLQQKMQDHAKVMGKSDKISLNAGGQWSLKE